MHLLQTEGKKGLLCLLHPIDASNQHPSELDCFFASDFVSCHQKHSSHTSTFRNSELQKLSDFRFPFFVQQPAVCYQLQHLPAKSWAVNRISAALLLPLTSSAGGSKTPLQESHDSVPPQSQVFLS